MAFTAPKSNYPLLFVFLLIILPSVVASGAASSSPNPGLLPSPILRRDEYSCDEKTPCGNKACCGKSGFCGYGPTYCGTTGSSPNDACWSNCDAHAPCGQYAAQPGQTCPLNVCCSQFGFCGTTTDFCGTGCQSNCQAPSSGKTDSDVQKRIVGYYESWAIGKKCLDMNINQIPVESLTHLNYAFAFIAPDTFDVGPMPGTDASTFSDFTALKSRNPNVVMGVSVGGWTFNDNFTSTQPVFSDMVSTKDKRATFIGKLVSFMTHYGFDAVDLDWEYPGAPDRQPPGRSDDEAKVDGTNYVLLLQEMRAAFDKQQRPLKISFTAPTSYWYLRWFDIKGMSAAADYVNFMTYDLHGTWDASNAIGNVVLAHTNLTEIDEALALLWRNQVDPAKVNLGLAFYSRTFTLSNPNCTTPGCPFPDQNGGGQKGACTDNSGTLSYGEITDVLASHLEITPTYDHAAGVKYFTWNTDQWASYDDEQTFQQKIKYANIQGLGGLLIWSVDQDDRALDALRGVLYPNPPPKRNDVADNAAFWQHKQPGACMTTECGGKCGPGFIEMTWLECPDGGDTQQKVCCPLASAPDPKTCAWRGNPTLCNGQCHGGEVALASAVSAGNGYCMDGRQFYCCPVPAALDGGINCGWKDKCDDGQTLLTFAGNFEGDADTSTLKGLRGQALSDALAKLPSLAGEQQYCCGNEEVENWKDCYWAGTTGKGVYSCDDNHCATGIDVELTNAYRGEGQVCTPMSARQRAFCCTPASGQSLFLPVPLEDLFPNPPPLDQAEPLFDLEVDDTWGEGGTRPADASDDPDHASFGFVVITSPKEVQVSLDRRDGSPWDVFDCHDAEGEDEQTVRVVCARGADDSTAGEADRCNDIRRGHGVPGTILQMPAGCGPGRYAVAKDMRPSANQSLPGHLAHVHRRRAETGRPYTVYDLVFDYNFQRVPRAFGDSMMRLDFSNEEGYWDSVVDRPGDKSKRAEKREALERFRRNRRAYLEDEWRDAYHAGALTPEELHRRWFGSDVLAWLKNLVNLGQAEVTVERHHTVREELNVILMDQQFSCPVGPAIAQASVKANLRANIDVDTTFGLTLIAKLAFPPDLSQSYLYFKNEGEIRASFTLDAVASISYSSGDIKLIGLDNFPGATFRVPGIVTVGPNMAVYASADAAVTLAGHLQADVTLASWTIQQTFPQTAEYPAKPLDDETNSDGTQTVGTPTFKASISANGEVALHLKPRITFGIVFDARWKVDSCSVDLMLDGYIIFHAELALATDTDNSCPFRYGIDGGTSIYAQLTAPSLFGWGGTNTIPIYAIPRKQLTPDNCESSATAKRLMRRAELDSYLNSTVSDLQHNVLLPGMAGVVGAVPEPDLSARTALLGARKLPVVPDSFSIGPLITIPTGFLNCPASADEEDSCPLCTSTGCDGGSCPLGLGRRDDDDEPLPEGMACPWNSPPDDDACTDASVTKRAITTKPLSFSWRNGDYPYSTYPSCSANALTSGPLTRVSKWYMTPATSIGSCTPSVIKANRDSKTGKVGVTTASQGVPASAGLPIAKFNTDHVFEVQLIALFLEWLCNTSKQRGYTSGPIPFPQGWGRPDATWCAAVMGPDQGFLYSLDNTPENFIDHTSTFLGGEVKLELLALLQEEINGVKKNWLASNDVNLKNLPVDAVINKVKNSAAVFQYLQMGPITTAWKQPANSVERVAATFDSYYWTSSVAQTAPGTRLTRPNPPQGVTSWGLRTLWCYWIDNHAAKVEEKVAAWLGAAATSLQQHTSGSSNKARNFLTKHMQGTGLATAAKMVLPRAPNFFQIPLPGTPGSAAATSSRYMLWGDSNNYGPLGL